MYIGSTSSYEYEGVLTVDHTNTVDETSVRTWKTVVESTIENLLVVRSVHRNPLSNH